MACFGSVTIIDRSGWTKSYDFEKPLVMIGSASQSDIVLPEQRGSGVLPIHLQVICDQAEMLWIRIINLSDAPLPLKGDNFAENVSLPPNSPLDVEQGDRVEVGDFSLIFSFPDQRLGTVQKRSEHIGLKLELPALVLRPGEELAGLATVSNFSEYRCQYELGLEGLPGDCYVIEPVPLLYPNAEEPLPLRIFHTGTKPTAGMHPFTVWVKAPTSYPLEEVVVSQSLEVIPLYQYQLEVVSKDASLIRRAVSILKHRNAVGEEAGRPPQPIEAAEAVPAPPPEVVEAKRDEVPSPSRQAVLEQHEVPPKEASEEQAVEDVRAPVSSRVDPFTRLGQRRKDRLGRDLAKIKVIRDEQDEPGDEVPDYLSEDSK